MRVARGFATSEQVAIGPAFLAIRTAAGDHCPVMTPDPAAELGRLDEALARSREQRINRLARQRHRECWLTIDGLGNLTRLLAVLFFN